MCGSCIGRCIFSSVCSIPAAICQLASGVGYFKHVAYTAAIFIAFRCRVSPPPLAAAECTTGKRQFHLFFFSLASSSVAINCSLHHPGQFKQNWMLRRINSFRVNLVRSSFGLHHAETVLPSMAQSNSIARFVKSFTLSRRISLSVNIDCQNFAREICQNNTNFTKGYRSILEQLFGWSVPNFHPQIDPGIMSVRTLHGRCIFFF